MISIAKRTFQWLVNISVGGAILTMVILQTPTKPLELIPPQKMIVMPPTGVNSGLLYEEIIPDFKDNTFNSGLIFSHHQGGEHLQGLDEALAPGACALDFNNDHLVDIFLVNGSGQTRYYRKEYWWQLHKGHALFENMGNGKFRDVTKQAGLDFASWGMGCVSGDLNNDGFADLIITNLGKNRIYKNTGRGKFIDVTESSGLDGVSWTTSASLADYNSDGLLDIYFTNYIDYKKGAKTFENRSQYKSDTSSAFDSRLYESVPNKLYKNRGDFIFVDVSAQAGVKDAEGRSLDVIWMHANADNLPDIFVINDGGGGSNKLFLNQGDGKFIESSVTSNLGSALPNHSVSLGDIDNDLDVDVVVTGGNEQSLSFLKNEGLSSKAGSFIYKDKVNEMNIHAIQYSGYSGWSSGVFDFNNDGWLDLFTVNGLLTPDPDVEKIPQGQKKRMWINQHGDKFIEVVARPGEALNDTQSARGAVFADFDNDGDIDVYIAHNNDLGQLLINELRSDARWIGIKLVGSDGNRDAIGSIIWVNDGESEQVREVRSGGGFLSSYDTRVHFGLGRSDGPVSLTIQWPDGGKSMYRDLLPNKYYIINKDSGLSMLATKGQEKVEVDKELSLKIGLNNSELRSKYLHWLVIAVGIDQALEELKVGMEDVSPDVRITAIQLLSREMHSEGLTYLIKALDDKNAKVRKSAVQAIGKYESEESVRWLIRMLEDNAPMVREATADVFAFFYKEEEAVIYRKYLAIPYLIRLLDDKDNSVRISVIKALANAENYRAVLPLIRLINDTNEQIVIEAVRALGLIREQRAVRPLLKKLNERNISAKIKASIYIALKRLAYNSVDLMLAKELAAEGSSGLKMGVDVINGILSNYSDRVVFNQNWLFALINERLFQKPTLDSLSSDANGDMVIREIINLNKDNGNNIKGLLQYLLSLDDANIRERGYTLLLNACMDICGDTLENVTKEYSNQVRTGFLQYSQDNIPSDDVATYSKLGVIEFNEKSSELLHALDDSFLEVNQLLEIANNEMQTPENRVRAIKMLDQSNIAPLALSYSLLEHDNADIKVAAMDYWKSKNKSVRLEKMPAFLLSAIDDGSMENKIAAVDILLSRREKWAVRTIRKIILDLSRKSGFRKSVIRKIAKSGLIYAPAILLTISKNKLDPLRWLALEELVSLESPLVEAYMWDLIRDDNESDSVRFQAAEYLIREHPKEVVAILQGKNIN